MLNPFNPQNPDWLQKSIGDLQTAIEMNDVIGAFKANALVLQNLISKINPELVLSTESQIISNSINELKQLIDSFIGFNISEKSLSNGQSFLFPPMSKGEAFVIRIFEYDGSSQEGIPSPNGVVWLGGYGGVGVGDGSMVICLVNNAGGTYNDVGHNFAIINQGKDAEILFVDELPDENLARTGVIYVLNSNNAMYVWDQQLGDYVLVGDVIPGTLISSTVFEDENNNVVVPEANKLYFDTTTEIYYRWNGSEYVSINSNTFAHLNDQKFVKYDESTGRLESGKISERTTGIEVYGRVDSTLMVEQRTRSTAATTYTIDLSDPSGHYDLTLTDNTSISFSNMIGTNQSTVITLVVGGDYSLLFPSWLKPMPNNDDYYSKLTSDVNLITILIRNGGGSPEGIYSLTNVDLS